MAMFDTPHVPDAQRYDGRMKYRRCGMSGLKLSEISLGCWHNFGDTAPARTQREMIFRAFDLGITHFDLANNYGPPFGAAERNVGRILRDLPRDELVISSKAGYIMWPGPYGEWGSRKHVLASLDQSLRRLGLDYVDIFYSHRLDPDTPLEETLGALDSAIRSGKVLYAGISSYPTEATLRSVAINAAKNFQSLVIHQPNYSLLNRWVERRLLSVCHEAGLGVIAFCPLYQGLLSDKYLQGIPAASRHIASPHLLRELDLRPDILDSVRKLNGLAQARGQSLAQMAIAWILRDSRITSVLCGASGIDQIVENCQAIHHAQFTNEELSRIDQIVQPVKMPASLWATD
jgi:L-glyceraldehyde 3-phosphate reductase